MGFRYRKSVRLTKGIKLNLNKNSTSVTFGRGRIKNTISSTGKHTRSVNLPGGAYYTENVGTVNKKPQKEYSPRVYKFACVSAYFVGVIFFLLGLLLLIPVFILGVFFLFIGMMGFIAGRRFYKQSKAL